MIPKFIPALTLTVLTTATFTCTVTAEEPSRATVKGAVFLPFDFYPKHREALRLNEEQVREMRRIAESMRDSGHKLEAERRKRTQALQDVMAHHPVEPENAMEPFRAVLETENEMKQLQFRNALAMRKLLSPEQIATLESLAKQQGGEGGDAQRAIRERLDQVRAEIHKRAGGGEPPREVMERFKQIEQAARQGRLGEAKEQLGAMLRHLRDEPGSRWSGEGKPSKDPKRPKAEAEEQIQSIQQKLEHADNPEDRERLQQKLSKLRALEERDPSSLEPSISKKEKASRDDDEGQEKRVREGEESAKRTNEHELRERLQVALRRLREATESESPEALKKIMRTIEPALREVQHGGKPQE
jgi:hypothetical protein